MAWACACSPVSPDTTASTAWCANLGAAGWHLGVHRCRSRPAAPRADGRGPAGAVPARAGATGATLRSCWRRASSRWPRPTPGGRQEAQLRRRGRLSRAVAARRLAGPERCAAGGRLRSAGTGAGLGASTYDDERRAGVARQRRGGLLTDIYAADSDVPADVSGDAARYVAVPHRRPDLAGRWCGASAASSWRRRWPRRSKVCSAVPAPTPASRSCCSATASSDARHA